MYKVIRASDDIHYQFKNSRGAEAIVTAYLELCDIYFYDNKGNISQFSAESFYKDLYPSGIVQHVDTRSGFVEVDMTLEEVSAELKRRGYTSVKTYIDDHYIDENVELIDPVGDSI